MEQTRLVGQSEQEEREFVVAPIGRNGQPGGIYQWIGEQQSEREDEEAKRLLYVAATRARKELHLLGTANIKKDSQELTQGSSRSLLGIAWPALAGEFEQQREEQRNRRPRPRNRRAPFRHQSTIPLRRLPADWKPPGDVTVDEPDSRERAQRRLSGHVARWRRVLSAPWYTRCWRTLPASGQSMLDRDYAGGALVPWLCCARLG